MMHPMFAIVILAALAAAPLVDSAAAVAASYRGLPAYASEELQAAGMEPYGKQLEGTTETPQLQEGSWKRLEGTVPQLKRTAASRRHARPQQAAAAAAAADTCRPYTALYAELERSIGYWRRRGGLGQGAVAGAAAACANSSSCIAFKVGRCVMHARAAWVDG
jgi:hypothetical protein